MKKEKLKVFEAVKKKNLNFSFIKNNFYATFIKKTLQ